MSRTATGIVQGDYENIRSLLKNTYLYSGENLDLPKNNKDKNIKLLTMYLHHEQFTVHDTNKATINVSPFDNLGNMISKTYKLMSITPERLNLYIRIIQILNQGKNLTKTDIETELLKIDPNYKNLLKADLDELTEAGILIDRDKKEFGLIKDVFRNSKGKLEFTGDQLRVIIQALYLYRNLTPVSSLIYFAQETIGNYLRYNVPQSAKTRSFKPQDIYIFEDYPFWNMVNDELILTILYALEMNVKIAQLKDYNKPESWVRKLRVKIAFFNKNGELDTKLLLPEKIRINQVDQRCYLIALDCDNNNAPISKRIDEIVSISIEPYLKAKELQLCLDEKTEIDYSSNFISSIKPLNSKNPLQQLILQLKPETPNYMLLRLEREGCNNNSGFSGVITDNPDGSHTYTAKCADILEAVPWIRKFHEFAILQPIPNKKKQEALDRVQKGWLEMTGVDTEKFSYDKKSFKKQLNKGEGIENALRLNLLTYYKSHFFAAFQKFTYSKALTLEELQKLYYTETLGSNLQAKKSNKAKKDATEFIDEEITKILDSPATQKLIAKGINAEGKEVYSVKGTKYLNELQVPFLLTTFEQVMLKSLLQRPDFRILLQKLEQELLGISKSDLAERLEQHLQSKLCLNTVLNESILKARFNKFYKDHFKAIDEQLKQEQQSTGVKTELFNKKKDTFLKQLLKLELYSFDFDQHILQNYSEAKLDARSEETNLFDNLVKLTACILHKKAFTANYNKVRQPGVTESDFTYYPYRIIYNTVNGKLQLLTRKNEKDVLSKRNLSNLSNITPMETAATTEIVDFKHLTKRDYEVELTIKNKANGFERVTMLLSNYHKSIAYNKEKPNLLHMKVKFNYYLEHESFLNKLIYLGYVVSIDKEGYLDKTVEHPQAKSLKEQFIEIATKAAANYTKPSNPAEQTK